MVMIMKNSKDLVSSALKTTQMGQIGIRSVIKSHVGPGLHAALVSQLQEYDSIEQEVHAIAAARNWQVKELDPGIKAMTDMMTRTRLSFGDKDSKAAAMMIQGNTRGLIKGLKNLHHYDQSDKAVAELTRKLLACEKDNIQQMQGFV